MIKRIFNGGVSARNLKGILIRSNIKSLVINAAIIAFIVTISGNIVKVTPKHDGLNRLVAKIDSTDPDEYHKIPVAKYIGKNGSIEVLDENLNIIYSSTGDHSGNYTPGILNFTSDVDRNTSYSIAAQPLDDDKYEYLISEYRYEEGESHEYDFDDCVLSGITILDDDYDIIYSNMPFSNLNSLNDSDIDALFDNNDRTFSVKHLIKSDNGRLNYLIIHLDAGLKPIDAFIWRITVISVILSVIISLIVNFILSGRDAKKLKEQIHHISKVINDITEDNDVEKNAILKLEEFKAVAESLEMAGNRIRKRLHDKNYHTTGYIHDINNSLTSIMAYATELGMDDNTEEENENFLSIVLSKAAEASELSECLSEYNKLCSPDFVLDMEEHDLAEVYIEFIKASRKEFKANDLSTEIDVPYFPVPVIIDKFQLLRVFNNFKNNFIKYCESGDVIYFGMHVSEDAAIIEIGNNGSAIEPEIREQIFNTYIKGRNSKQGSGLGLALAAKLISMHSGSIELADDNSLKYTNLFRIELPLSG